MAGRSLGEVSYHQAVHFQSHWACLFSSIVKYPAYARHFTSRSMDMGCGPLGFTRRQRCLAVLHQIATGGITRLGDQPSSFSWYLVLEADWCAETGGRGPHSLH